jgi:uncharacterized protein YutE (UPF0331/DUF86 family)
LEVGYVAGRGASKLEPVASEHVARSIQQVRSMLLAGEVQAALLLGWSTFEAAARKLEPTQMEQPKSASALIELFTSLGHLTQEEAQELRPIADHRNAVSHGQLSLDVRPAEIERLLSVAERLQRETL